jgi:hypothetical protein
MPLTAQQVCDSFSDRAASARELIDDSYRYGLGVSEETLTDVTLVELKRRLFPHVETYKFTKKQENAVSGADWLWSIGRRGKWFSILVQAKLARPGRRHLHGLHHGDGAQRETLVSYAAAQRCLPLYLVYTGTTAPIPAPPICLRLAANAALAGCSIVRTRHVANMYRGERGRSDIAHLLSASFPLSCLFCCFADLASPDLADVAAAGVRALPLPALTPVRRPAPAPRRGRRRPEPPVEMAPDGDGPRAGMPEGSPADDWLDDPRALITDRAPDVVEAILAGREVPEAHVGIVTIISSEPILES